MLHKRLNFLSASYALQWYLKKKNYETPDCGEQEGRMCGRSVPGLLVAPSFMPERAVPRLPSGKDRAQEIY